MNFFRLSLLPLLLLFGSARSLECRTGFNTSFFSLPIEMWQETGCADNSVCFLSEISHDRTETLGQRVSISFGACLSKVYESQLECKNLFATGGLFPNQLISLIPDLQPQIYQLLTNLANKTSNSVLQYLSGGLNIQEGITEQILDRLNITIPNGFQSIVKRIDQLFIALFNNNETARVASLDALLNSFNSLIISDPPIAVYLEDYYHLYNLPIPDKYKPLISGSLSYIHQFLNQNEQFVLTQLLSSLSKPFQLYTNSVQPQVQKLMDVLNGFIPVAVRGNQQNIVEYALQGLGNFSYSTTESQVLGQEIISYIELFNITINVGIKELILGLPGIFNAALPNNGNLLASIFSNIANQLKTTRAIVESSAETAKETDLSKLIESILMMTGRNLTGLDRLYIRSSIFAAHKSLNETAQLDKFLLAVLEEFNGANDLGLVLKNTLSNLNITLSSQLDIFLDNLQPLVNILQGNSSAVSGIQCPSNSVTKAFATELNNELGRRGFHIPEIYRSLFECYPAILYNLLPNNAAIIDSIFTDAATAFSQNISTYLRSYFVKLQITLPDEFYSYIDSQQNVFDAAAQGNLSEVFGLLLRNIKDQSKVMELSKLVEKFLSSAGITGTAEAQRIMAVINGFVRIATTGDRNSIAQYAFQALQNFSVSSNESQELGKAIVSYIEQFNVSLTPVLQGVIIRFPGLFNLIFPNKTEAVNQIFHSISVEFNKMNISDPFGYSLNLALRQLEMANILLPQETVIFITSLQDLYFALLKNDQSNIFQWMTDVLMGTYNETTNAANRLSESLKDVIEQITRKPIDENIGNLVDYSLRIPIKYFPENINLINMIYENITYHLQEANFTHYDPTSLDKIFNQIDISMLPAPLRLYINITRDLIKAVIANDTDKLMEIGREAFSKNCVTNNVTNSFVAALVNDLNARGVIIPGDISITLQCIPGIFYSVSPNNIDVINSILQQATVSISLNATELLRSILSKANVTLPEQIFDNLVIQLEAIDSIARLNTTQGLTLLLESYKKLIKETELSKLIELMITQTGKNLSDNDLLNIRNSASSFYRSFPDKSATLDLFFSSIRNDLILGKELGLSLKNAFSLINVTIPANWDFILDNFGPIFKLALGNAASASNINCSTTPITGAFSSVLYNQLIKMDVNISNQYSHLFECFPAVFYASFPNETVRLDSIFALITSSISQNNSQTLQSIFQMYNINIPQGVYDSLISQLDLLSALSRGNSTEIYQTWLDTYKKTAVETELSQLIEIILTKAGRNITDLDKLHIKNSAFSFYQGQSENKSQLDMLFSSIRSDFNSTSDWGLVIENALSNSNVTLPSQVNILLDNLQPIIYILAGNSSLVSGINCPSNSISKAFATDVTSELGKRGVHIPDQYKHVFECFPSVFYNVFPNNTALIDSIFTDVTSSLTQNISASFRSLFVKLGITLPGEFYTYVDSQQAVFSTLFQGNLSDVLVLLQGYFNNQSEVMDLSKHLETLLSNIGVMQTSETHRITALIKGFIQAVASGDTNKFNETEVIKSIFQAYNVTIPAEFNLELSELTQAIREIISSSNATDLARKIRLLVAKFAPQNELSKFLVTVLTKSGASGDLIVLAKQIAAAAYTNLTDRFLNNLFSSLNTDIASGVDVGVAIRNALISVNLTVQREVDVLISNLQPLVNAIFAENTTAIPSVIQSILEAYATEFPEQTYYRLSTEMFALGFVLQTSNGLLTNEAIDTIVNIYNTILTTVNITQKNLTELLVSRFLPELEPYLFLINAVEPKDAVLLAVNFTTWLINPNRDAQMLFAALNRTIHTVYNRLNVDIREEIKSILNPELCRYGVCSTNLCNVQGLLRNITAVTSQPETTKSPPNLTNETTSQANIATQETTQTSTNTTTQPSTSNITVTSKMGLNAKNNFSWFTIVLTSLFAFIASLS